jgi:hypothetical protein
MGAVMFDAKSSRRRLAKVPRRSLVLLLVVLLLLTACGSHPTPSPNPAPALPANAPATQVVRPPLVERIVAVPPDVPQAPPACDSKENLALANNWTTAAPVPSALQGLESTCANYPGNYPEVMVVYNLTNDVLAISPANGTTPQIVPHGPRPSGLLPSWDDLEILAQNAVVSGQQARAQPGTYLIPVGGEAVVWLDARYPPLDVNVSVDEQSSKLSYAAQLITGYVTDNLVDKVSALSYASSIIDCVNQAYSLWQNLTQGADAATTATTALQTITSCKALVDEVRKNREEALAAVSAADEFDNQVLRPNLEQVAKTADSGSWETEIAQREAVHADVFVR